MSESFIVRRGGGGGGILFAAIGVTYPEGSTCTCTDGVKSFTAKDTSGKCVFAIPYAATWTVTATYGTSTKSENVEIAQSGESVSVELAYWNGELYDMGDEFASVTGGWAVSGYKFDGGSGGTLNTDHIYLPIAQARSTRYAGTQNAVDITGWNQINISYATSEGGELTTISVDVSSVDGTYFVAVSNNVTFNDTTINIGILQNKESGYLAKKSVVRTGAKYVYKIWMS